MSPERYVWQPGETPIFTRLLHQYDMGFEQNLRLWYAWTDAMYYKYASSGVCHCGIGMDDHNLWTDPPHNPVEMMYF